MPTQGVPELLRKVETVWIGLFETTKD